jgi:hypothetical protein
MASTTKKRQRRASRVIARHHDRTDLSAMISMNSVDDVQQRAVVNDTRVNRPSRRTIVSIFLAAILILGVSLRLGNLGGPDFGVDETFHVYAAQRLIAGDPPLLPSGLPYDRSRPYTQTVAWAAQLLSGLDERTARVPSVVFGSLTILVVFLIGRWYSTTVGLVAAFVTAVAPMQVAHSRQVRMYALFQLLYLIIIYLLYQGFETATVTRRRWVPRRLAAWCRSQEIRPGLLVVAAPIIVLAGQTQDLLYPSLAGPTAYVVCMALVSSYVSRITPGGEWKYRVAAALLVGGALLVFALDIGSVRAMYSYARNYAPTWAQAHTDNWRFYVYVLGTAYPTIFGTFLFSGVFALTRNLKATLYIMACFTVPFLLHSFLFAWKEDRYILHIMPLLFIVFGVGVSAFLSRFYSLLTVWARHGDRANPQVVAGLLTAMALIFVFGATKELREGVKLHNLNIGVFAGVQHYNWQKAMEFIGERARPEDVIITARSLAARYYGPNLPTYYLNHQELDTILTEYPRDKEGRPLDIATGAPVILDVGMLEDVVRRHLSGWFVSERPQLGSVSIPTDLSRFIERHLSEQVVPDADDMAVFSWGQATGIDAGSR